MGWPDGASTLHWYLDGTLIQEGDLDSVSIAWTTAGTYELCVDASNRCTEESEDPDPTCITIVIEDVVPIDPDPVTICHDDTYFYAGIDYPPGVHPVVLVNPAGCDSNVTLTVIGVDPVVEEIGSFYLCEGATITVHGQTFTSDQPGYHSILTQQAQPPQCDSTIVFNITRMNVQTHIMPPVELDCMIKEVVLNGSGSAFEGPPDMTVVYQWHAFVGGAPGVPSDAPAMSVNTPGQYCLDITITAPDGSTMCQDSACVIVSQSNDIPPAPQINGPVSGCAGDTHMYTLHSQGTLSPAGYTWIIPPGLNIQQPDDSTLVFIPQSADSLSLCGFISTNECGNSNNTCIQILIGNTDTLLLQSNTCDPALAGVFTDTLSNQAGCDSIVIRTISLLPSHSNTFISTTCDPGLAGSDTLFLLNQHGCDSTIIMQTDLLPSHLHQVTVYTCDPLSAGLDTLLLTNQYGCDSIVHVERIYTGVYQEQNQVFICGTGANYSDTVLVSSGPCDSLFIIQYNYFPQDTTNQYSSTCDPAQVGQQVTVLQDINGCDSTIITTTTLLPSDVTYVDGFTCVASEGIIDTLLLTNQAGCDSLVYIAIEHLGIDTQFVQTLTCDSALVGSFVEVIPGPFCDTVIVTNRSWAPFSTGFETIMSCDPSGPTSDTTFLTASSGCDSLHILNYVYTQIDAEIDITSEDCAGRNNGSIHVLQVQGGEAPYQYRLNSGLWQPNAAFNSLPPGNYTLTVQDLNGCTHSNTGIIVDAGQQVKVDAGPDSQVEPGTYIELSVQSTSLLSQIQWQATDPLGCATCATTPLGPITVSQTVTVQGWTAAGCSGTDQVEIRIKELQDTGVYIPNSFSPNGDGINDVFRVYGDKNIRMIRQLAVYDRWGNALLLQQDLHPDDPSAGWDGTFRGRAMDPGVYVYAIELELTDGRIRRYKGDVQLLR